MLVDGWQFVMVAGDDGAEEGGGVSVCLFTIGITGTKRTTLHGFRAFLSIGLGVRVTTRRAATHCARGSRFACSHSAFSGTSSWPTLHPIA